MVGVLTLLLATGWLAAPDAALLPALPAPPALPPMHSPHDVIDGWAMSPDFEHDQTLFLSLSRFNLMLRTRDGGKTFEPVGGGLDNHFVQWLAISTDYARDQTLWCSETNALFASHDRGEFWLRVPTPPAMRAPLTLACSPDYGRDGTLAVGTQRDGLWISRDRGVNWSEAPVPGKPSGGRMGALNRVAFSPDYAQDGALVAVMSGGSLVFSSDRGESFSQVAGPGDPVQALVLAEDFGRSGRLWVGTRGTGVWRSDDRGASWQPEGSETGTLDVLHLSRVAGPEGGVLFASTAADGVLVRKDGGSWTSNATGLRAQTHQTTLHYTGTMPSPAFARDRTVFAATFEGLHVSNAGGDGWQWINVLHAHIVRNLALSTRFAVDRTMWLSTYGAGVQFSSDGGKTFGTLNTGNWPFPDGIAASPDFANDRTLLVGAPHNLMLSTDGGKTIQPALPGAQGFPRCLAFAPDYARSGVAFAYFNTEDRSGDRFVRTADRCATWTGCDIHSAVDLAFAADWPRSGRVFAACPGGLFRSEDRGQTFRRVEELDAQGLTSVAVTSGPRGDVLMACSLAEGVHLSHDGGKSWTLLGLGLPPVRPSLVRMSPAFDHDGIAFAGPANDAPYVTRNGGRTWSRVIGGPQVVMSLAVSETFEADRTVVVGSYEGPWMSNDAGVTWTRLEFDVPVESLRAREPTTAGGVPPKAAPQKPK